jgi:general secretion pathway protein I
MAEWEVRRSPALARAQSGFALLEVLVAAAIAALALGVMFHSSMDGLRAAQAASHYEQAVARARSHLTLAVHASPLVAGDWQGDDGGGFSWHLRVVPVASATVKPATAFTLAASASFPLTLYDVRVSIAWRDGGTPREVQLDTEQIGQGAR